MKLPVMLLSALSAMTLAASPMALAKTHACKCSKDCAKTCKEGGEKSKDCKCDHCGCAKGEGKCEKCHGDAKADGHKH